MSELYMHFPDETALCRCDNCGHECQAGEVGPIADFEERVAPGEICPAGECPECGCLMHVQQPAPPQVNQPELRRILASMIEELEGPMMGYWTERMDDLVRAAKIDGGAA